MKFTSGLLFTLAVALCISSAFGFVGRVQTSDGLYVRAAPTTRSNTVSIFGNGAQIDIDCQVTGDTISGTAGTSNVWYHVPSRGGYVSAAYVANGGQSARGCGGAAPAPSAGPARVHTARSETLNIRSGPTTRSSYVGSFGPNAELNIDCQTNGDNINGDFGSSNIWYHIPSKGYVSGAFVSTGGRNYPGCASAPAPSGGDCSAGLRNPRSCAEAVAWAEAHLTTSYNSEYRGLCDHFVGLAYGRSASTFDSAIIHWRTTPEQFRHYDRNPPAGALCFFNTGVYGHATICTGGGGIISTDWGCQGCLGKTTIDGIESRWGAPYLGWTNPYFHNA